MKRLLACVAMLWATVAAAQYPDKPVRLVVPFAPGGNIDFIARTLQSKLSEYLGVSVVIDNRPGAGGILGAAYAARQPADGYTLLLANTGVIVIYPAIYKQLSYDPLKDFVPVARATTNELVAVVNPGVPARDLKEFIAYSKSSGGKISAAVAGVGSSQHFAMEMVKRSAGVDMLMVPYKASVPALNDVLGGQVQFMVDAPPVVQSFVQTGRLRALAVTGSKRLATLPNVPTFTEAGLPGIDATGFQGFLAPAGTPDAIVNTVSRAVLKALQQPEVVQQLRGQGLEPAGMDARAFNAFVHTEAPKWANLAKAANIKAD
ncbi:tripartite tricarboxylate transporter substrate binding protein [Cupriavidus sp. WS]|uniref:Bug family tripartite tricarboxylate transporter substrate binding protein n=1 Tax=Cupriavidus sp. WS TaxID=1312922 RepID=UPI0003676D31|nr:tripartite tricarboxylate transporter substrate binding protein [Cupriavidus sp. WS]